MIVVAVSSFGASLRTFFLAPLLCFVEKETDTITDTGYICLHRSFEIVVLCRRTQNFVAQEKYIYFVEETSPM